jgi:hypothetical protein
MSVVDELQRAWSAQLEEEKAHMLVAACQTLDDREVHHHDCLGTCPDWEAMLEAKDTIQRARFGVEKSVRIEFNGNDSKEDE